MVVLFWVCSPKDESSTRGVGHHHCRILNPCHLITVKFHIVTEALGDTLQEVYWLCANCWNGKWLETALDRLPHTELTPECTTSKLLYAGLNVNHFLLETGRPLLF